MYNAKQNITKLKIHKSNIMTQKTIYLLIIGLLISGMAYSQLIVKKVSSELALDGLLEETFWDISNEITANENSTSTASFGVLWDETYLYVGVNVTDALLCTNKRQGYYDDGVEIYIDGNNQGTTFDDYDRLFVKPIRSYWIQEMEERYEGVIHKYIENANGYTMEFAIPWDNFNVNPSAGMDIGFNMIINDDQYPNNQHNVPQRLYWVADYNYDSDPSTWGTLTLSSETTSYSADYIALIDPNGGDFCINNKTTDIHWVSEGITNIDIEYSNTNGSSWNSIATNLSANSNSYAWNVAATPSDQCLIRISETGNSSLKDISESVFIISAPLTGVEPLIPNTWKNYQWPYNAYFPEDPNGINGHVGSACGHATLARTMHYWEFPIIGNDALDFTDNAGHRWTANFGATTYNYDNMPNYLPPNSTEEEYKDVATLTYHAATSMNDYWGSGGDLANMSYALSHYFNYKVSTPTIRTGFTKAEWIQLLMHELDNGRVLLIDGMTTEVLGGWHVNNWVAGHWFHVDGYNEDGLFHGILGFSDEDGYFDIEELFNYSVNNGVLIGLEPNLNGKELSLLTYNAGESIQAGQAVQINWSSTAISNLKIEYTIDNGQNWIEIVASTSASTESYNWTTPNITSDECKIKLTDVDDINVYDKSNKAFSISLYELVLKAPNGGESFIAGDVTEITWESTPVENIKIEYSSNNGANWSEVTGNTATVSGSYDWTIPNEISNECLIKITDIADASVSDISENTFNIIEANNAGGPYLTDDNTVLLMHFNGNLTNNSTLSTDGSPHGNEISYGSDALTDQNQNLNLDGYSYITIPHNENLNLTGNWTIEAWIKVTEYFSNASSIIVRKPGDTDDYYSNYALELQPWWGNVLHGLYFSNEQTRINITEMSPSLNQWYHVAFLRDASNSEISIIVHDENWNEVSSSSKSYSGNDMLLSSQDIRIGEAFKGYIDELRISNVVRSFENTETGIDHKDYGSLISLYPNPASKHIYISSSEIVNLSIVTITGQKIIEINNFLNGNIDISALKKGVYIVLFSYEKGVASKRLIIER